MPLLQEMCFKLPTFGQEVKIDEQLVEMLRRAKERFLDLLGERRRGTFLVKDVFALVDKLNDEYLKNNQIACGAGCAYCCRQLVCSTTLEAEVIIEYLGRLPRTTRREITRKARKEAMKFYERNRHSLSSRARWEEIAKALRASHYNLPCLFLNSANRCSIYPARPIDCRTAKTKKRCGMISGGEERPKDVRLFCDQIAANLITEEEERVNGVQQVSPLIALPISRQFGDFFG